MNNRRQLIVLSFALVLVAGLAGISSAATLTGRVMMNHHPASATVVAVPYDPLTRETNESQAVVVPTDALGRFQMIVPEANYVVAAWDGRDGAVVDSPTGTVTLNMTDQTPPNFRLACTQYCHCMHLVGNLYWMTIWDTCGVNFSYLMWGCRC